MAYSKPWLTQAGCLATGGHRPHAQTPSRCAVCGAVLSEVPA